MFTILVIVIIICYLGPMIFGDSSESNYQNNNSSSGNSYQNSSSSNKRILHPRGEFETGFYNEEVGVFVKGPVFTYSLSENDFFFVYGKGKLSFKNSNDTVEVQLLRISDRRIVPTCIWINGAVCPVIDRNGEFVSGTNFLQVSIAKTVNYLVEEQTNRNVDKNIQSTVVEFLVGMLTFNMMVKRKIILNYNNEHLEINNASFYHLKAEYENTRNTAWDLIDKYSTNYAKESTNKKLEQLLAILELPPNTRDIETIKRQYRKLAKKYHPDRYESSDKKFKEISNTYTELCLLLGAA